MKGIKYLGCFLNPSESQKLSGADVVFKYEQPNREIITVLACQNGECWQQWGAEESILSLNVDRVDAWFRYINNHSDDLKIIVS